MSRKDIGVFGDPSYLVKKFDDIESAVRSERSQTAKEVKSLVDSLSTAKDNLQVHSVVKTKGRFDGNPVESIIVHVGMGLNGPGKESDYAVALKRLLDTGKFHVVDAYIDAIDDLWDFLLSYKAK